ncbi:MAG: hypothetical protein ACD_80C00164G0006 [uncultured bacterium (gcode 4)]|uniref:Uncharacterized protein n=1 Tax=uncultured bacterium (gcode 4) TaxID=1234023 RepID=K1XWH5_9BACT|nr:MAG: hypothetical protein ACD_80C00164G0006 [uncultured bacterium (gcode 4)]HBB04433.1 hypothetical protein [Candidatus Gracilibacteria bacterium]
MNEQTTTKTKLRELGHSKANEKATPGNFRAIVILDSISYHIGEDTPNRDIAAFYCAEYGNDMQLVQIFDDKGEPHIIGGILKKME